MTTNEIQLLKIKINNQRRTNINEHLYKSLLLKCLLKGDIIKSDRTKIGTHQLTNVQLSFDLKNGVPLITGKRIFWKNAITETELLYINGITNLKILREHGIKYWDKFDKGNGTLGPVYGAQWVNWNNENIDQLKTLVKNMRANPFSRRLFVSAWNPSKLSEMALPPCPVSFQVIINEKNEMDMHVYQRSGDGFLGVPFDIFQFYYLMEHLRWMAKVPYRLRNLTFSYGSFHIYNNHIDQTIKYLNSSVYKAPTFNFRATELDEIITDYRHGEYIKGEINE